MDGAASYRIPPTTSPLRTTLFAPATGCTGRNILGVGRIRYIGENLSGVANHIESSVEVHGVLGRIKVALLQLEGGLHVRTGFGRPLPASPILNQPGGRMAIGPFLFFGENFSDAN